MKTLKIRLNKKTLKLNLSVFDLSECDNESDILEKQKKLSETFYEVCRIKEKVERELGTKRLELETELESKLVLLREWMVRDGRYSKIASKLSKSELRGYLLKNKSNKFILEMEKEVIRLEALRNKLTDVYFMLQKISENLIDMKRTLIREMNYEGN